MLHSKVTGPGLYLRLLCGQRGSCFGGSKTENLGSDRTFFQLIHRETGEICAKAVSMEGRGGCERHSEGRICRIWVADGIQGMGEVEKPGGCLDFRRMERVTVNPEKIQRRRVGLGYGQRASLIWGLSGLR